MLPFQLDKLLRGGSGSCQAKLAGAFYMKEPVGC